MQVIFHIYRHQGQDLLVIQVINPIIYKFRILYILFQKPSILLGRVLKEFYQGFPILRV